MAKRAAESEQELEAIKNGERPMEIDAQNEAGEFEDEFEDEFESEDEILEAGVDGRPDEEREAEERENGMDVDKGQRGPYAILKHAADYFSRHIYSWTPQTLSW